ncbi:uncharacterized protein [Amphiura filiformis]|uniref:uncharacterized protein n=1 Tax=Amphiura filiformis TaxID=82378 RepID=UPI003B21B194
MVMSIFTSLCAGVQIILESLAAAHAGLTCYSYRTYDDDIFDNNYKNYNTYYDCNKEVRFIVCHSLTAVIGLAEMIIAIVSAAYCCNGGCCSCCGKCCRQCCKYNACLCCCQPSVNTSPPTVVQYTIQTQPPQYLPTAPPPMGAPLPVK